MIGEVIGMKRKLIFILLLLFLTSCLSQSLETLLNDKICLPPCWYGLAPEKTSMTESEAVLRSLPFVSSTSIQTHVSSPVSDIGWLFTGSAGRGSLIFDSQKKLDEIRLNMPGLRLGVVVDAFGNPDSIWGGYYTLDGTLLYEMLLFYPNSGITVRVVDEPSNVSGKDLERVTRNLLVDQIQFYAPMSVELFLANIDHRSQGNAEYFVERLQKWPGFGDNVVQIKP